MAGGGPTGDDTTFRFQYASGWNANVTLVSAQAIHAAGRADNRVARRIDHTLLKPDATREQVVQLCEEAKRHNFYSVCINSSNVALCAELLKGSQTVPICVVGFPLGASLPQVKAFEAKEAIALGAREIDTVVNIGALKSGDYQAVLEDLAMTVEASAPYPVKVILETSKLNDEEKVAACVLSRQARAAFVKTSTGFGGGGATIEDVALMKRVVGGSGMKVKASGGVRTHEDAWKMIEAGADRLGASSSVAVVTGGEGKGDY
ncbi:MAG TPA: deoxyribose-phosphate aldolase [Deltaproteobacteria bacterium]|nr:deoxyribose-phosphate aldolase [Deltaproteobacteria bacterium]HCP46043.1 deoxyribose-phosphate aldolase [Deltaproteobacteria bacterium]